MRRSRLAVALYTLPKDLMDGAITNGVTKEETRVVFLQTAIYCGVPAAIDALRNAREIFKELGI